MSNKSNNPHNFGNLSKKEVRELAAKGGHNPRGHKDHTNSKLEMSSEATQTSTTGHQGGSKETNPGNFAYRPKEEVVSLPLSCPLSLILRGWQMADGID